MLYLKQQRPRLDRLTCALSFVASAMDSSDSPMSVTFTDLLVVVSMAGNPFPHLPCFEQKVDGQLWDFSSRHSISFWLFGEFPRIAILHEKFG